MKLQDGYLIHFDDEKIWWVAIFHENEWWACRDLLIGENPTLLKSYSRTYKIDSKADVHIHAHVMAYPIAMLGAVLNNGAESL